MRSQSRLESREALCVWSIGAGSPLLSSEVASCRPQSQSQSQSHISHLTRQHPILSTTGTAALIDAAILRLRQCQPLSSRASPLVHFLMFSSSPSPSTPAGAGHRVQSTAPTQRRAAQQQHSHAPSRKQQKTIVKLTLGSPYQLPTHILSLNDSLQVLDLLTKSAPLYSSIAALHTGRPDTLTPYVSACHIMWCFAAISLNCDCPFYSPHRLHGVRGASDVGWRGQP